MFWYRVFLSNSAVVQLQSRTKENVKAKVEVTTESWFRKRYNPTCNHSMTNAIQTLAKEPFEGQRRGKLETWQGLFATCYLWVRSVGPWRLVESWAKCTTTCIFMSCSIIACCIVKNDLFLIISSWKRCNCLCHAAVAASSKGALLSTSSQSMYG